MGWVSSVHSSADGALPGSPHLIHQHAPGHGVHMSALGLGVSAALDVLEQRRQLGFAGPYGVLQRRDDLLPTGDLGGQRGPVPLQRCRTGL